MAAPSKLDLLVRTMPDAMAELVKDFTAKRELNSRVEIRMRIKALLDFLSADTVHPPNPMLKEGGKGIIAQAVQSAVANAGMNDSSAPTSANVGLGGIFTGGQSYAPLAMPLPIGEARPIMDNTEVLG